MLPAALALAALLLFLSPFPARHIRGMDGAADSSAAGSMDDGSGTGGSVPADGDGSVQDGGLMETLRLHRGYLLEAIARLRDVGLTPDVMLGRIGELLPFRLPEPGETEAAGNAVQETVTTGLGEAAEDAGALVNEQVQGAAQEAADSVREAAGKAARSAAEKAAESVREFLGNLADRALHQDETQ